jgi:hypothetical protein
MEPILEEQEQDQEQEQQEQQEQEQDIKDCLVCLQPCEELSVDLFLYTCSCIYPVHDACFKQWRHTTKNDRVCMICREELEYNTEEEEEPRIQHIQQTDERLRSIEEAMELEAHSCINRCRRTMKKIIWFVCLTILISILLELVRGRKTRPTPSSPPQASSS